MDREQLHKSYRSAVDQAGGFAHYARVVGKSRQAIEQAIGRRAIMPAEDVLKVERALSINRSALRPDLYPLE